MLRQRLLTVTSLLITISLAGCEFNNMNEEEPEPFERRELPRQLTEQEAEIVNGSGAFGFNLMHRLLEADPDQSHFISPLSIQIAYGMTMNGAEGETYRQMQEVFGLEGMSRDQINQAARELIDLLSTFDEQVRFNIANSIWYRDTFSVEQDFLETNRDYYDATIEAADFGDPETVKRINGWVSEKTEGLIEKIVEGAIDPLTVMYLINAIYFNGDWTVQFDPDETRPGPFHRPDGSTVEVDMMHMEEQEQMLYQRGEDYQAVNLYYGDAGFAMTLVLPDDAVKLESWLAGMDWNAWQELTGGFQEVTLSLKMPKFEMEYEIENFKEVLQDMGIADAFDPAVSDFSRINPDRGDLHISETRHKTFVRVNEEGTEAAAVTSVEIGFTSVPQSLKIRFDRPFFFVIREAESGTILFMGVMTDPSS